MEKLSKEMKLRLIAMFLLSNLSSLMLGSSMIKTTDFKPVVEKVQIRQGYTNIALRVHSTVDLNSLTPFVITNSKRNLYVPYVFYQKMENEQAIDPFAGEDTAQMVKLVLSVPERFVPKLLKEKHLLLVPQIARELILSHTKRRESYEIHF